jgi:hypothetical protein
LAGRGDFYRVIYGSKPSMALMSEFLLPMPPAERDSDEESDPIQISAHGLDFQIDSQAVGTPIVVGLTGAVYVRVLPSAEELAAGAPLEPRFPLNSETRAGLKAKIREGLQALRVELGMSARGSKMHTDWSSRSLDVRRKAYRELAIPFENALDRSKPESEREETDAESDAESESDAPPECEAKDSEHMPDAVVKSIPPPGKWVRLDLELPGFRFAPETAERDAGTASASLNAAIAEHLRRWASSEEPPHGGKLWGFRRRRPILPSDVRNWTHYLDSVRKSNAPVVVPTFDLRWDVRAVPDPVDPSRLTVHVALENWSEPTTSANRKEVEPSLFHVSLSVSLPGTAHRGLRLDRVKPSYRYNEYLQYAALGFNAGVLANDVGPTRVLTTTWAPRYVLPRMVPIDREAEGVRSSIASLAREDCIPHLRPMIPAYEAWLAGAAESPVDSGLDGPDAPAQIAKERLQLQQDLDAWRKELGAIRAGIDILEKSAANWSGPGPQKSPLGAPFEAWLAMNSAMARVAADKGYTDWRLFQLAFILACIPAFATRIPEFHAYYTAEVAEHANAVTLLYFATGGGKSEAFLGLLLFVLFLDRLRGKHHGVSALMRYPLRLLTLQQARRTFNAVGAAEDIRHRRGYLGEPFSLGFWVGGTNTPNWHSHEGYSSVPTVTEQPLHNEEALQLGSPYKTYKEQWLKLDRCPFCGVKGRLALRRVGSARGDTLGHFCTTSSADCSWNMRFPDPTPLPFYVVDEDIYDLAPSILLGTVDKLAALGQSQGTIRKFFGIFGFAPLVEKTTDRLYIPLKPRDWSGEPGAKTNPLFPTYRDGQQRFFDPFPSLLIQDEAHLLDESLGTFAGLFESALEAAFERLSRLLPGQVALEPNSGNRRKIKVIAASATVNEPQRHMRNLYQRPSTVQFPYPGPHLYRSFYAEPQEPDGSADDAERRQVPRQDVELRSHWARVYGSILTNGHRHTVAMASVLGHFHLIITGLYERLRSDDPQQIQSARDELLRWLSPGVQQPQHSRVIRAADPGSLLTLVDLHRISLTYVTNKKGGDQVIDTEKDQFAKLHESAGYVGQELSSELISGAVSAADIQSVVRRAETRVGPSQQFPDLNGTLRSIIATSAISHGIDVEEFNAMFFAGMPSDIAEYIQASSRVGRTHVGFSVLVPVPQRYRDRFIFEIHDIFHRFLERMILPAAVDRWAEKALVRVMPSFFQEFVCGVHAIEELCAADPKDKALSRVYSHATDVRDLLQKAAARADVESFLIDALGLNVAPAPDGAPYYRSLIKNELADYQTSMAVERLVNSRLGYFFELRNASLRPMTSLRDVDLPGIIHESGVDAAYKRVPEGVTAKVMRFIRRGSGADIDDIDPAEEGRE